MPGLCVGSVSASDRDVLQTLCDISQEELLLALLISLSEALFFRVSSTLENSFSLSIYHMNSGLDVMGQNLSASSVTKASIPDSFSCWSL